MSPTEIMDTYQFSLGIHELPPTQRTCKGSLYAEKVIFKNSTVIRMTSSGVPVSAWSQGIDQGLRCKLLSSGLREGDDLTTFSMLVGDDG